MGAETAPEGSEPMFCLTLAELEGMAADVAYYEEMSVSDWLVGEDKAEFVLVQRQALISKDDA